MASLHVRGQSFLSATSRLAVLHAWSQLALLNIIQINTLRPEKVVNILQVHAFSNIFSSMKILLFEFKSNRMAWQWAETLVEIRVTLADIRGTTK